jgi:tRNA threonylcarbamoyl adenosine modification protein YeaZ
MKILAIEFSSCQRSVAVIEERATSAVSTGVCKPGSVCSEDIPSPPLEERARERRLLVSDYPCTSNRFTEAEVIAKDPPRAFGPRAGAKDAAAPAPALSLVEAALRQAGMEREHIESVAVGLGPGSYNGIRAAIALAQGWQLAREVKVLGISSVECIAAQAQADGILGRILVVIDAQRGEFYLAGWEISPEERREIEPLRLATLADAQAREEAGDLLVGPEVSKWFPSGRVVFPRSAMLGRLAAQRTNFIPGERLEPIYLRETTFVKAPPPRILPGVEG